MSANKHVMYFQCCRASIKEMHDWKVGRVGNIFAPVTSDSPQCDLETIAVKIWESERGKRMRMMRMKMITSTSLLVEGGKKITPRLSKWAEKTCNCHYQRCGQLILNQSAPTEYKKAPAYMIRMKSTWLRNTEQWAISNCFLNELIFHITYFKTHNQCQWIEYCLYIYFLIYFSP